MPASDALIEAACWIIPAAALIAGCWICAHAIGMERALRRAGGMQAWRKVKR